MTGNPYLALEGIAKSFPGGAGVEPTALQVEAGEMLVLLGPSGCGKTTLLNMIAGLIEPDAGTISIAGQDITRVPTHRRDISMVFQTWALFPTMTVAQNVGFGLRMRSVPRQEREQRVAEALDLVQLGHVAERKPGQLSGGQQQRVALARAIVTRPKVLLLDEPLSSLDHRIRVDLRRQLRILQRELGLTGIYVTHDHAEALALGDRIAVMRAGAVVEQGTPREVFAGPKHRYTAEFLSVGTVLDRETYTSLGAITPDGSVDALCIRPTDVRVASGSGAPADGTVHDAVVVGVEYQPAGISYSFAIEDGPTVTGFSSDLVPQPLGLRTPISIDWRAAIPLAS